MRHTISILVFLCALLAVQQLQAQPPLRRAEQEKKKEAAVPELSVRAKAQYTGQVAMPEELIWKREIYRTLDLNEAKNSPLYYPVEPLGDRMNLFTYLFRLLAEGKIPAYEYRLDGTEVFTEESKMNFRDMLDRFHIYYEEVVEGKDTLLRAELLHQGELVFRPAFVHHECQGHGHLPGAAPGGRLLDGHREIADVLAGL